MLFPESFHQFSFQSFVFWYLNPQNFQDVLCKDPQRNMRFIRTRCEDLCLKNLLAETPQLEGQPFLVGFEPPFFPSIFLG